MRTAALKRLAHIAPSIHSLSPIQASRIISIATKKNSEATAANTPAAAAQSLVAIWFKTECAAFGSDASKRSTSVSGKRGQCDALENIIELLKTHTDDEGLCGMAAALSLAAAVGTANEGVYPLTPFRVASEGSSTRKVMSRILAGLYTKSHPTCVVFGLVCAYPVCALLWLAVIVIVGRFHIEFSHVFWVHILGGVYR